MAKETGSSQPKPAEQPRQDAADRSRGAAADTGTTDLPKNGVFDGGFETYRTVTQESYRSLLTSGLIVLDTNALLNLYRYHAQTRMDWIEVLNQIKERLWVPHQAMLEFWQGRPSVIDSHSREIEDFTHRIAKTSPA